MQTVQIAAVMMLASGVFHAVVNAIFKSGKDKLSGRALIECSSAVMLIPFAFVVPLPHGAWHWIVASWLAHVVYLIALVKSFERADMSVAYPLARGSSPVLAALLAVTLFHEPISAITAIGIFAVSSGVMIVGLGRNVDRTGVFWSLLTGCSIAVYVVCDAQGVRAAPTAGSYIVWIFLFVAGGISSFFALWRGRVFIETVKSDWRAGLAAGFFSILSYGLAIWALRLGDTPRLAALRETSILFGMAIAIFILKEKVTRWRLFGVAVIAAGAGLLIASAG